MRNVFYSRIQNYEVDLIELNNFFKIEYLYRKVYQIYTNIKIRIHLSLLKLPL